VDPIQLNLASFESIKSFAVTVKSKYEVIDVLINNAGIMAVPKFEVTEDGIESQIGF
jgi:NAD(P)-dependent dehydrogenase (short-subunit alcohol dehydrogenase family)